jgi:hypothetical protein
MKKKNPNNWLRWIARITGTLLVAFTLFMFIGELIESIQRHGNTPFSSYKLLLIVMFVVWGIALAGLIIAWWKEGLGGTISLVAFWLVYILNLFNEGAPMRWDAIKIFLIFSFPAILYLIYWKLQKDDLKKANGATPQ